MFNSTLNNFSVISRHCKIYSFILNEISLKLGILLIYDPTELFLKELMPFMIYILSVLTITLSIYILSTIQRIYYTDNNYVDRLLFNIS